MSEPQRPTAENDAPVVWHDEAQRFNDLGLLDPPTFCACDDCLCVLPPGQDRP